MPTHTTTVSTRWNTNSSSDVLPERENARRTQ